MSALCAICPNICALCAKSRRLYAVLYAKWLDESYLADGQHVIAFRHRVGRHAVAAAGDGQPLSRAPPCHRILKSERGETLAKLASTLTI